MDGDEESVVASNENAHRVLEWQLYTYHHIQNLATGVLGAVFSGLAIIITVLTAFRGSIPGIPWQQIAVNDVYDVLLGYSMTQPFVQAEVALNWIMSLFGFVLAGSILAEAIYFFGTIVLGDRLLHLATTHDLRIVPLPQELINRLPVTDSVVDSRSEWILANAEQTDHADELLRHGLYRLPIILFLTIYYVYIYFLSVEISLPAILINQINTILFSVLFAYAFWEKDRNWRIATPTTWLWVAQIIFAFVGLGLFIYGLI